MQRIVSLLRAYAYADTHTDGDRYQDGDTNGDADRNPDRNTDDYAHSNLHAKSD